MKKLATVLKGKTALQQSIIIDYRRRCRWGAAKIANRVLTGIYWWVPCRDQKKTKIAGWRVTPYYSKEWGEDLSHWKMWPTLLKEVSVSWGKDFSSLQTNYTGLPRGRVDEITDGPGLIPVINHGGDIPKGGRLSWIKDMFNLPVRSKFQVDEHEKMRESDAEAFQTVLGIRTGLKKFASEPSGDEPDE